jgi:holo-[acyl-carrier protein] synthase
MVGNSEGKIVGIGVDLVKIARIEGMVERHGERFLRRVFDAEEIAYAGKKKRPATHLACRFAAKEAVSKAFGTGFNGEFGFSEIAVHHNEAGKPEIVLSGKAEKKARRMGVSAIHLSLSHDTDYAIAQVVLTL